MLKISGNHSFLIPPLFFEGIIKLRILSVSLFGLHLGSFARGARIPRALPRSILLATQWTSYFLFLFKLIKASTTSASRASRGARADAKIIIKVVNHRGIYFRADNWSVTTPPDTIIIPLSSHLGFLRLMHFSSISLSMWNIAAII